MLIILELYAGNVSKKIVYKHTDTIEVLKISLLFNKNTNFTGKNLENSYD